MNQSEGCEHAENLVDSRRRHGDDEKAAGSQVPFESVDESSLFFRRNVLEDREHRDDFELGVAVDGVGEDAREQLKAVQGNRRGESWFDSDAICQEVADLPEEGTVVAADVEESGPLWNEAPGL